MERLTTSAASSLSPDFLSLSPPSLAEVTGLLPRLNLQTVYPSGTFDETIMLKYNNIATLSNRQFIYSFGFFHVSDFLQKLQKFMKVTNITSF